MWYPETDKAELLTSGNKSSHSETKTAQDHHGVAESADSHGCTQGENELQRSGCPRKQPNHYGY